ncbi:MAG: cation transport family protein [Rhodospirillaceae bacterium]|nr:MAG: cation transport family protein [Rhodospirillaceae bacterium]
MYAGRLDLRPVFLITGLLLTILALTMLVPAGVAWASGYGGEGVFAASAAVTFFAGGTLVLASRVGFFRLSLRQAFMLTTAIWIVLPAFAALPFVFSETALSYTDAFFEAMSGLTTTGSTVIVGLESVGPGVLFWRALLQWLGGIGIILTALLVLPALGIGGMQMFRVEAIDAHERLVPRVTALGMGLVGIYIVFTALWALLLWLAGLSGFDAVVHAMTTLSTGGFSTSDRSIAAFDDPVVELVLVAGMITGSLPFFLYLQAVHGAPRMLLRDTQVRTFLATLGGAIVLVFGWLWLVLDHPLLHAARMALFTTTSVISGTGYILGDFWQWGGLAGAILFFLATMGGCAGSSTCAIKVFRFQILYATAKTQVAKLIQPHGIFIPYYNYRPIPEGMSDAVLGFFFLYAGVLAIVSLLLSFSGLDFENAFSIAAMALSNVGQGRGGVCLPFAQLPDATKWILSATMLVGRLEMFSVLVLFLPTFWKK